MHCIYYNMHIDYIHPFIEFSCTFQVIRNAPDGIYTTDESLESGRHVCYDLPEWYSGKSPINDRTCGKDHMPAVMLGRLFFISSSRPACSHFDSKFNNGILIPAKGIR